MAGVSERQAYKVMRGTVNLRPTTIAKFSKALGVSVEFLTLEKFVYIARDPSAQYGTMQSDKTEPKTVDACVAVLSQQLGVSEQVIRNVIADLVIKGGRNEKTEA